MCGISGVFTQHLTDNQEKLIQEITQNQYYRGPDYQAIEKIILTSTSTLLAHNRLSIIDLSNLANQPMWDNTNRYCITYNGEIYNYLELRVELQNLGYTFKSQSDTEVILNAFAAWGIHCLDKFYGPFAFAILDTQSEILWLCRDRFGVRPLFYIQRNNQLYFASSTKILAKKFNLKPNFSYITNGIKNLVFEDGSENTAYLGLQSLPAGNYLKAAYTSSELSIHTHTYYDLNDRVNHLAPTLNSYSLHQLLELTENTLENAVKIRLRSDVPIGISLSSGLDSTTVAALARKEHDTLIGFSYGHPSQKKSEGPLIAECAQFLKINIEYIAPQPEEMIAAIFKTIKAQDAPFSSLSVVAQFLLYEQVKKSKIKVLLGGQGGDESFMGYKKYLLFRFQQLLKEKKYLKSFFHLGSLIPMFIAEIPTLGAYWKHRHRYIGHNTHSSSLFGDDAHSAQLKYSFSAPLSNRQIQDITQFSLPTLLRYEDRNAMGNSIESRLPFLDHRIIELGVALPISIKLRKGFSKWPIRKIMQDELPNKIRLARYKRGFDLSINALLNAGLGQAIRNSLHNAGEGIREILKRERIDHRFSDRAFLNLPKTTSEAIALLWLQDKL